MTGRRALFLDKDGVIIADHGYVCTPGRSDFIDGIFDLCRASTQYGFLNVVVTNQAGIARGYYSEPQFLAYMEWLRSEFRRYDAQLDAVYYCPHHPLHGMGDYLRDCECRKPRPGMLLAAQRDLGLDLDGSILVGDSGSDIEAGNAAGVGTCLRVSTIRDQRTMRPAFDAGTLQRVLTHLKRNDARSADT